MISTGDGTRQLIIMTLMNLECGLLGMRVGEISRPAVSHHLKILKDAEIVNAHHTYRRSIYNAHLIKEKV